MNKPAAIVLIVHVALICLAVVDAVVLGMWMTAVMSTGWLAVAVMQRQRAFLCAAVFALAAPLVLTQVSIPELAAEFDAIACRVRGAHGQGPCAVDDATTGPVLSARQHLAVRLINAQMAAGGAVTGFHEVAWETMQLDWQATTERQRELQRLPFRERRRMCQKGAADGGPTLQADSDFAMDSAEIRRAAAKLARRTRDGQRRFESIDFPGSYARHPWHVVLALWVPGAKLHAERDGELLEMRWRGDIHYPLYVIDQVKVPRLFGRATTLTVDEAMFCGLQMDGVFAPYMLTWSWRMQRDDPRLDSLRDSPGWFEKLARSLK